MLEGTCAYCATKTHFTARTGFVYESQRAESTQHEQRYGLEVEIAATCDNCKRFNAVKAYANVPNNLRQSEGDVMSASEAVAIGDNLQRQEWVPPAILPVSTEFIPTGVAGYFQEAHDAYSVAAYRAVLLLVRSTVEASAKDKGVRTGNLFAKIDALEEQRLIRPGTKDMAHALRVLGNDAAHGDIDTVPTEEDARDALTVAQFVLDDVYVADARRIDMMSRRGAKPNQA